LDLVGHFILAQVGSRSFTPVICDRAVIGLALLFNIQYDLCGGKQGGPASSTGLLFDALGFIQIQRPHLTHGHALR